MSSALDIDELFGRVCDLDSSERRFVLDQECADDPEKRRRIESLVRRYREHPEFLDRPAIEIVSTTASAFVEGHRHGDAHWREPAPERIGSYRVLGPLGEGGMGVVYRAEQDHPRREVAIKVMGAGRYSPRMLRRFEYETEVLGGLQHPGIAQIHEAGTVDGLPFFAMEFVDGEPLTEYADEHDLDLPARLRLLAEVCDAVEYAHQRGVIHRDLKPGNILVGVSGRPKILDFGLARAVATEELPVLLRTQAGQILGTVPYLSPEQAHGEPAATDTRSDVYALGVIAYELLSGELPYELEQKKLHEAVAAIKHDEPKPLSSRNHALRGDLETIVHKALQKEKERRYSGAGDLARDIRRYLANEPILARPPSVAYQARKFVQRNKPLVASGAVIGVVVLAAIVIAAILAVGWRSALADAQRQLDTADAFRAFLDDDLFEAALVDRETRVRDVIDRASPGISDRFDDPLVEATVRQMFGNAYRGMGEFDLADEHLSAALRISRMHRRAGHRDTLRLEADLGLLRFAQGERDEAQAMIEQTMAAQTERLGLDHRDTLKTQYHLATMLRDKGETERAESVGLDVYERSRRVFGTEHRDTLNTMNNLAQVYSQQGRFEESEELYRELIDASSRVLDEEHPETLIATVNLGVMYVRWGRFGEAVDALDATLDVARRVLGEQHPTTLACLHNLATARARLGLLEEAESSFRDLLRLHTELFGSAHEGARMARTNLAFILMKQKRYADAEPILVEAIEINRRAVGEDDLITLVMMNNLGNCYLMQERLDDAGPLLESAVQGALELRGESDPYTSLFRVTRGRWLAARGMYEEAQREMLEAHAVLESIFPEGHQYRVQALQAIVELCEAWGKREEAEAWRRRLGE